MICGTVTGGLIGLAWVIGFIIYFYKRHRRESRARAAGLRGHREMLDPLKKNEAFIIPPDPAIVQGQLAPGDRVYDDPKLEKGELPRWSKSMPLSGKTSQPTSPPETPTGVTAPLMPHTASEPTQKRARPSRENSTTAPSPQDLLSNPPVPPPKGKGKSL